MTDKEECEREKKTLESRNPELQVDQFMAI